MRAIYYGHASVQLDLDGASALFDPFITPNVQAKAIDITSLNPNYIFLSHAHEDHVADAATIQQQSGAKVVAVVETAMWINSQGVPQDHIIDMNFGGTIVTSFGTAKMVYALHTSGTPDGKYGGVPVGYVLKSGDKTVYFAGDTALTMEMKLLADFKLDWAFLPIGGHYTMDVNDAIVATKFINCTQIVGIHYDTFPAIAIDKGEAKAKFAAAGLTLHLPEIGGILEL